IRQNIVGFAFGFNALAMASATFGILGPVAAAILHQAGSLLVLLNAMRLLAYGDWHESSPVRRLRGLAGRVRRLDETFHLGLAFDRILAHWKLLAGVAMAAVLAFALTSNWTAIGPGEVGLLQRQGRFAGVLGPGCICDGRRRSSESPGSRRARS